MTYSIGIFIKSEKYHFELCVLSVLSLPCFKEKGQAVHARISSPRGWVSHPSHCILSPFPGPFLSEEIQVIVKIGIILNLNSSNFYSKRKSIFLNYVCKVLQACLFKYTENFTTKKMKIFRPKILIFFHISGQNIDCGYWLKPHR